MGDNLIWTGLTLVVALPLITNMLPWAIVGAIIMIIALILKWADK